MLSARSIWVVIDHKRVCHYMTIQTEILKGPFSLILQMYSRNLMFVLISVYAWSWSVTNGESIITQQLCTQ